MYSDPPVSGSAHPDTDRLVSDRRAPYGSDADGSPLTREQYEQRYVRPDGWPRYPSNDGATPGTIVAYHDVEALVRDYGSHLDRIGRPTGEYLGLRPDGVPATFEQRSLPVTSLDQAYHQYQLTGHLPDGWRIEVSEIAPGFGRPGGGIQLQVLDETTKPVAVRHSIAERSSEMNQPPYTPELVEYAERAGYDLLKIDDAWILANSGGETRLYLRQDSGAFVLTRADRAEPEGFIMSALEVVDLERYLTAYMGSTIRSGEYLSFIFTPWKVSDLASGWVVVVGSDDRWYLSDPDGRLRAVFSGDDAVEFSWIGDAPLEGI
ncbi:MAG: Imm61 family immunity protein [Micrococcales bacterium]|nr:Imm61 family immunity protein [Micrococcales bacterium]